MVERPEFIKDEYLEFLFVLRESGVTNMFGATPYLTEEFSELDNQKAKKVLLFWMENFQELEKSFG
jgi:hypothetical protein